MAEYIAMRDPKRCPTRVPVAPGLRMDLSVRLRNGHQSGPSKQFELPEHRGVFICRT